MAISVFPSPSAGIPKGNTASRPATPSVGDIYYNGELEMLEIYNGTAWVPNSSPPGRPTIGTVTKVNDGTVSIPFTGGTGASGALSYSVISNPAVSTGLTVTGTTSPLTVAGTFAIDTNYTFQIAPVNIFGTSPYSSSSNSLSIATAKAASYLIVAGGGSGGANFGGGAGAGGLVTGTVSNIPVGTYAVTVGSGGASGGSSTGYVGFNGGNSSISGLSLTTALGGGTANTAGGCGGGGSSAGVGSQGFNGGTGGSTGLGGGGGLGAVGSNGNGASSGGAGGAGTTLYTSWTGTPPTRFGGGGGGIFNGAGGAGGGGGAGGADPSNGTAGTAGTGSGGGGARGGSGVSGAGGSGFVIIRYTTGSITATGGTVTNAGDGMTYHTFTGTGNFVRTG